MFLLRIFRQLVLSHHTGFGANAPVAKSGVITLQNCFPAHTAGLKDAPPFLLLVLLLPISELDSFHKFSKEPRHILPFLG